MTGLQAVSRQMLHSKNCTASTFSSLDWIVPAIALQLVNGAADRSQAEAALTLTTDRAADVGRLREINQCPSAGLVLLRGGPLPTG
jgi:hypothetical protein